MTTKWISDVEQSIPVQLLTDHLARRTKARESVPLLELFLKYTHAECEEILDKAFGLHALADWCCKLDVQVTYELDWEYLCSKVLAHHLLQHLRNDIDSHVSVSQEFNCEARFVHGKFLGCPPAPLPALHQLWEPREHKIVSGGYYGAPICFISPSLDSEFSLDLPKLNPRVVASLRRALRTHENRMPFLHLDLVWPAIGSSCHVEVGGSILGSGIYYSTETLLTVETQLLHRWYAATRERVLRRFKQGSCRLAFAEHGLICFVPENTQTGDLICHFRGSNVLAIIRLHETPSQSTGSLVGRAADIFDHSPESIWTDFYLSDRWQLDETRVPLTFEFFDFSTFQMMTRPSASQDLPPGPPPPAPIFCDRASHVFCSHAPES
jgi:hypothetical protein